MTWISHYEIEDNQGNLLKTVKTARDLTLYADSLTEEEAWDMFVYAVMDDGEVVSVTFDGEILN